MAKEVRWEVLFQDAQGGAANAIEEFRNDSSDMIHIREIRWSHQTVTFTAGDQICTELSKSPALAHRTPNNVFFTLPVAIGRAGVTGVDDSPAANGVAKYARGQLTLEPGESLYANHDRQVGAADTDICWVVGYEF